MARAVQRASLSRVGKPWLAWLLGLWLEALGRTSMLKELLEGKGDGQ